MSEISKHVGENDPELTEALAKAGSVAEMQEINRDWAVRRLGAKRDIFSPDKLIFDEVAAQAVADAAAGTVSRTEKIFGVDKTFTGSNLPEVEQQVAAAWREAATTGGAADADAGAARSGVQARHPKNGQFIDPTNPAVQVELKALLIRGEISTEEFIAAQPQLLDETMRTRYGIDPEKIAGDAFSKSWADKVTEFLNGPAGDTWPGGEENKQTLGRIIAENNLQDNPSVETLARVYEYMKENDLLVENPDVANQRAIGEATSFEDLRQASWKSVGGRPRGVWNH